jgi:hypothetical protein
MFGYLFKRPKSLFLHPYLPDNLKEEKSSHSGICLIQFIINHYLIPSRISMKTLFRHLSLILCLELILGPMTPHLSFVTSAHAQTCPQGQSWQGSLNECVTNADVSAVSNSVDHCGSITDSDQQKQCYSKNAQDALDREKSQGHVQDSHNSKLLTDSGKMSGLGAAASAAAITIPIFMLTEVMIKHKENNSKKISCSPTSLLLMYGAAGTLALGEILTFAIHTSKLNKAKERWKEITNPDPNASADKKRTMATEAQSQAFELLAQNEDSKADVAKTKFGFYLASTGLFAAAALAAALEQLNLVKAYATLKLQGTPETQAAIDAQKVIAKQTILKLTCGTDKSIQNSDSKKPVLASDPKDPAAVAEAKSKQVASEASQRDKIYNQKKNDIYDQTQQIQQTQNKLDSYQGNRGFEGLPGDSEYESLQNDLQIQQEKLGSLQNDLKPLEQQHAVDVQTLDARNKILTQREDEAAAAEAKKAEEAAKRLQDSKKNPSGSIQIKNMKRVAIYNLRTARNTIDLLQLLEEFQSIEFENFSKANYLDDSKIDLKEDKIDQFTASLFSQLLLLQNAQGDDPQIDKSIVLDVVEVKGKKISDISNIVTNQTAGATEAKNNMSDFFYKAITKPVTRIAINGVLGGWMGIMSKSMNDQKNVSENRAKVLRKIRDDFNFQNGIQNCSEADRSDTRKPYCYCYTSDNQHNPARNNSQICTNLWATSNNGSNNYLQSADAKVCLDQNNTMDSSCSCKTKKNADGTNTCMKIGAGGFSLSGINPNVFKMLSAGAAPANSLLSGNMSAGQMDAAAVGSNAAKIKSAADSLLAKADPAAAKEVSQLDKSMSNAMIASGAGLSMGGGSSLGSNLGNMTPQQAAAALDKELAAAGPKTTTATGGKFLGGGGSTRTEQLEFGLTPEQAAAQEEKIAEMNADLDYGKNDINHSSTTNIFEVLSNRYQRSGMRRLFEGGEKVEPDKPAKTDIAQ